MKLEVCDSVGVRVYIFTDRCLGIALIPYVDWRSAWSIIWIFDSGSDEVLFGVADEG